MRSLWALLVLLLVACGDADGGVATSLATTGTTAGATTAATAGATTATTAGPTTATTAGPTTATTVLPAPASGCADVVAAVAERVAAGTWTIRVTVRSADTGPEKYADEWEVRGPDGVVLGTRTLLHDHVNEQPFTRSLGGVAIPDEVGAVTIAARDSVVGFCGAEFRLTLER